MTLTPEQARLAADRFDSIRPYLPIDGLIHEYCRWATHTTHAPPLFHIGSILPGLAVEANRLGWRIWDYNGRRRPFKVCCALVGSTGTAKSTAIHKAEAFILDWMRMRGPGDPATPYIDATGSVSGLFHALRDKFFDERWGITTAVLMNDEVTTLMRQQDLADNFNRWHEGKTVELHLRHLQKAVKSGDIASDANCMKKPVLSALFATTEAALQTVTTQDQKHGGLFNRLLWVPADVEGRVAERQFQTPAALELRAEVLRQWHQHELRWQVTPYLTDPSDGAKLVIWSVEATAVIKKLFDVVSAAIKDEESGASLIVRAEDHAIIVASLFALSRILRQAHGGTPTVLVTAEDAERAVAFILACIERARKIDSTVGVDEMAQLREFTLEKIAKSGKDGARKAVLYRGKGRSKINAGNLGLILQTLMEGGFIVEHAVGKGTQYWTTEHGPDLFEVNRLRGLRIVPKTKT